MYRDSLYILINKKNIKVNTWEDWIVSLLETGFILKKTQLDL